MKTFLTLALACFTLCLGAQTTSGVTGACDCFTFALYTTDAGAASGVTTIDVSIDGVTTTETYDVVNGIDVDILPGGLETVAFEIAGQSVTVSCQRDEECLDPTANVSALLAALESRYESDSTSRDVQIANIETGNDAALQALETRYEADSARVDVAEADIAGLNADVIDLADTTIAHNTRITSAQAAAVAADTKADNAQTDATQAIADAAAANTAASTAGAIGVAAQGAAATADSKAVAAQTDATQALADAFAVGGRVDQVELEQSIQANDIQTNYSAIIQEQADRAAADVALTQDIEDSTPKADWEATLSATGLADASNQPTSITSSESVSYLSLANDEVTILSPGLYNIRAALASTFNNRLSLIVDIQVDRGSGWVTLTPRREGYMARNASHNDAVLISETEDMFSAGDKIRIRSGSSSDGNSPVSLNTSRSTLEVMRLGSGT